MADHGEEVSRWVKDDGKTRQTVVIYADGCSSSIIEKTCHANAQGHTFDSQRDTAETLRSSGFSEQVVDEDDFL